MTMMHAIRVHAFGGPDVLRHEEVPIPDCGPDEVVVRVRAAGVGPWDAWVRAGQSVVPQPLPLTPGSDISGEVVAVGANVTGLATGAQVYGATNGRFTNGYADFALCEGARLAHKPQRLMHAEAASAPVIAVTAWQMLFDHAALRKNDAVLIHGAAGNVGSYAVQLARQAGLHVLATASPRHDARLKRLGADSIVDPAAASTPVAAVIDLVGGDDQARLLDWLSPRGRLISAVQEPDARVAGERGVHAAFILVEVGRAVLESLSGLFDRGDITPWVGEVMPLADAVIAHEMLAGMRARPDGKIMLEPAA